MVTRVADAESLPFADGEFDVALSTFGVMFAPDQQRAAAELLRVVRPGGRIGLANWTPEGFIGELFRVVGRFVPPPAGLAPPAAWGTETRIVELFGPRAHQIQTVRRKFVFRYRSAEHWIDEFRAWYGPVHAPSRRSTRRGRTGSTPRSSSCSGGTTAAGARRSWSPASTSRSSCGAPDRPRTVAPLPHRSGPSPARARRRPLPGRRPTGLTPICPRG